jgi:hypothetical protein
VLPCAPHPFSITPRTAIIMRNASCLIFLLAASATQAIAQPLPKAEFDAVVAEAVEIYKQDHRFKPFQHPRAQWRTLDRDKLARLLEMPEFAALDNVPKEPLIDQAGAWDLMPFDSPAAALAQWEKWLPAEARKPVKPGSRDVDRPYAYCADYRWAPVASANVALMHCYPNPAWYVRHDEPMLWTLQYGGSWDQPNVFDFGQCVLQQGDECSPPWPKGAPTPRGKSSAAILEGVLSRYLLANGRRGEGPNRCLPMLHALRSLDPRHESLVPILKTIEPGFALDQDITVPEAVRERRSAEMEADLDRARDIARQVLTRYLFLVAKIPVLLAKPDAWPAGEIERSVGHVVNLALKLNVALRLKNPYHLPEAEYYGQRSFANPWAALTPGGVMPAAVEAALRKLGREMAAAAGCGLAERGIRDIPAAFWIAYAEAKLAKEQTTCGALAEYTDAGKRYGEAVAKNDGKLLAPIAGLKPYVDGGGAAQKELVDLLATNCPQVLTGGQADPWRVCGLAAKARAEEEARRKAAEPPAPPPPAPACSDDLPARVAKRLGYLSQPRHTACKPMPNAPGKSIIALADLAEGIGEGEAGSGDDGSYDVDVLVVDSDTSRVRNRLLLEKAYESDAVHFQGMQIDTARYRLSPKVRAFGVRAEHAVQSHVAAYSTGALSLFVEQGGHLRRVLADLLVYRYSGESGGDCNGSHTEVARTIAIAPTSSKGFADLLVTTSTAEIESHPAGDDCVDDSQKPVVTRTLLHFDGKTYPVPDELRQ